MTTVRQKDKQYLSIRYKGYKWLHCDIHNIPTQTPSNFLTKKIDKFIQWAHMYKWFVGRVWCKIEGLVVEQKSVKHSIILSLKYMCIQHQNIGYVLMRVVVVVKFHENWFVFFLLFLNKNWDEYLYLKEKLQNYRLGLNKRAKGCLKSKLL